MTATTIATSDLRALSSLARRPLRVRTGAGGSTGGAGPRTEPLLRCSPLRGSAPQGGPLPRLPPLLDGGFAELVERRGAVRTRRRIGFALPVASETGARCGHGGTASGGASGWAAWSGRRTSRRRVPFGQDGVGDQFEEGHEHERSFVHAGVGDGQAVVVDRQVVDQQDVDVDRSAGPSGRRGRGRASASTRLTAARRSSGSSVVSISATMFRKSGCSRATDGIRLPDAGRASDRDAGFGGEQVDGALERARAGRRGSSPRPR